MVVRKISLDCLVVVLRPLLEAGALDKNWIGENKNATLKMAFDCNIGNYFSKIGDILRQTAPAPSNL
ncbi:hypothetical protein [Helicobacter bizzozeronii]|uniref:hypothetical protein n=1 Tax=Helicobacter bizzozeronii TaxID=56877 RepID=UPI0013156AE8|nr:hypothetical protein [Helicobacter bizzozeronii]